MTATTADTAPANPKSQTLSEDWLAVFVGLSIVALVILGVVGPGPQTVTLKAPANTTKTATALPLTGWKVSSTLGGKNAALENATTTLTSGTSYLLTCAENTLTTQSSAELPPDVTPAPDGKAQLILVNNCAAEVTVTYTTSTRISYPLFNLLGS